MGDTPPAPSLFDAPPNAIAYWPAMQCWITKPTTAEALAAHMPNEIIMLVKR